MKGRTVLTLGLATALAASACGPGEPESGLIAITGGLVYPVSSEPIPGAPWLIRDGKIEAVGAGVSIPAGAEVIDATGMSVIPGIIETHSHTGFKVLNLPATGSNNNELSVPINAHVRAIDGLDSKDPALALAVASGITTQNITTGSRSPNSGQSALVKMRGGTVEDMYLAPGGIKFAIRATTPYPNFPENEQEVFDLLSGELEAAQEYLDAIAAHEADPEQARPPRNLTREALGRLLTREWVLGIHSSSEQQMRHAMEIKRRFDLDAYIHHGGATLALAEELHELGMPVSFGPVLPGDSRGERGSPRPGAARGTRRGWWAFHQDPPDGHPYWLRHTGAMFVRQGMPPEEALAALTLNGRPYLPHRRPGRQPRSRQGRRHRHSGRRGPARLREPGDDGLVDGVEVFNRETGYNVFGNVVPEGW